MTEFEVLGTDKEVDLSDPAGSVMSLVWVVMGAAALFVALPIGRQIANAVTGALAGTLGMSVGDNNPGLTFGSMD